MSSRPASPARAGSVPAPAQAIVELVNSRPHAIHPDRLDDPVFAAEVVRRLAPGTADVQPPVLEELRALRGDIVAILDADADADADAGAWRDFTARTSSVSLRHDFSAPGEVALRQVAGEPVVGGVALAVADLVSSGAWSRVRICANDECGGAFYDVTRSRTQRWHSYETCGNRVNVAAHRARTRHAEPSVTAVD